ncbi:sensor histidine kinase [Shewanella sp. SR44-3]|uniref:sensor histidine kinase n=1 Tax=Shewanella sp. SR44-3 TaxID=2760936 RepID=UPI0015FC98AA|nr:sensor histidine kinase [Shewanella sp. SR44-3]MBB1269174.1 sensor histidine kinase [Shewanella sp. SR44-3]
MKKHTTRLLNILAVLGLTHLVVFYTAMAQTSVGEPLNYHPDGPFWLALQCFLAQWLTYRSYQRLIKGQLVSINAIAKVYLSSAAIFIVLNSALVLGLEWAIGIEYLDFRHISLTVILSILLHLLLGGTLLAALLFNEVRRQQLAHIQTQNQLANSKISALQQQLDPHFLFNNLNVLSVLIQQDPDEADDFLDAFCSLYRYMLEAHKNQLISLERELEFADSYLHLLAKRFPNAFTFELTLTLNPNQVQLIPGALQLALENIVKHNQASPTQPMSITITNQGNRLLITNDLRPKSHTNHPKSLHLGLKNLSERCTLIVNQPISIEKTAASFCLSLPLVDLEVRC